MLYSGRLAHEQKGILFLPEILAGLRTQAVNATLTIVGEGPDAVELRDRLAQACEPGTFGVLPAQTSTEIYRLLLSHHVLLMPSFFEGLPIISLEAQACGCVPVGSNLPGVTNVAIEDGKTGFLCPIGDVPSFVDRCTHLANSHGLWHEMSQAGHHRIEREFTTDLMVSRYLELFERASKKHGLNPGGRSRHRGLDWSVYGWRGLVPNVLRRAARTLVHHTSTSVAP